MNQLEKARFVERPQFFNGQTLFANDLQAIEAFNREMRWLHNRLLHQTGAIGNGYAIGGEAGASEIIIGAGMALDHLGREIVLLNDHNEPVPPVAGDDNGGSAYFYLTVSYPADDQLDVTETRTGFCDTVGAVRIQERPIVTWVRLKKTAAGALEVVDGSQRAAIKQGALVVIGQAAILDCKLESAISLKQRRSARPACRPYIQHGESNLYPSQFLFDSHEDEIMTKIAAYFREYSTLVFDIEVISIEYKPHIQLVVSHSYDDDGEYIKNKLDTYLIHGFKVLVDTMPASFAATPHYSARVEGSRYFDIPEAETHYSFVDSELFLTLPSPTNFTVQLRPNITDLYTVWKYRSLPYEDSITLLQQQYLENFNPSFPDENLTQFVRAYLNDLGVIAGAIFLPDDWKIVWMGVEG